MSWSIHLNGYRDDDGEQAEARADRLKRAFDLARAAFEAEGLTWAQLQFYPLPDINLLDNPKQGG